MSLRKLVTIRKITEVTPIKGADFIELARVDGWKCVVKKGEFKVNDLVVYFEIDSFLPIENRYEFLRKNCLKSMFVEGKGMVEGFRLRTIKLRNEISQGLVLPLSEFPEINVDNDVGIDLSDRLGVLKYEIPVPDEIAEYVECAMPTAIKRTEQERIQNLSDYFTRYKDVEFEETEKEDGNSTSFYLSPEGDLCSAGHYWEFKKSCDNTVCKHAERYGIEEALRIMNREVVLQGETVGEGILKNKMGLKGQHFHIFDIYDTREGRYLLPSERYELIEKANRALSTDKKLVHVPIINKAVKIFQVCKSVDDMLKRSCGETFYGTGKKREGLVYKSTELIDGQVLSFKVVDNKNLVNDDD